MDQLKEKLGVVVKYGFWIASVLVLLGSVGIWFMTTSHLASENESQTQKLNSAFSQVSTTQGELSTHPNKYSHEKMEALIEQRKQAVLDSWKMVYEEQKNILTWPNLRSRQFTEHFANKMPYEQYMEYPIPADKGATTTILRIYKNYIGEELPKIAKLGGTEWTASLDMKATVSSDGGYGEETVARAPTSSLLASDDGPLVAWSTASQESVKGALFPWLQNPGPPNDLEVYYSQESIWILRQMLEVVAKVNGDATQPFQAKIREIVDLGIGDSVVFGEGELSKPGENVVAGDMYSGMGGGYEEDFDGYSSGYGDSDASGVESPDPAENRYVDLKLQPITAATLRGALTSHTPENAPLAVAKRVPVKMTLMMDQRAIPELLAECGSAPLKIVVEQVNVLGKEAGTAMATGAGGYGGGGGEEEEGGYGDDAGGYGEEDGGYGGEDAAVKLDKPEVEENPLDRTVEVYGLIYIYNPPNEEALGIEKVTEEIVIDGSAEENAAAAAAAPAAPATTAPATPAPATSVPPTPESAPEASPQPADDTTPTIAPPAATISAP